MESGIVAILNVLDSSRFVVCCLWRCSEVSYFVLFPLLFVGQTKPSMLIFVEVDGVALLFYILIYFFVRFDTFFFGGNPISVSYLILFVVHEFSSLALLGGEAPVECRRYVS